MAYLTQDRQREIDEVISSIYLATNKKYPDDGLIDILQTYGIDVAEYDFGDDSSHILGAIKYPDPDNDINRPIILVNDKKPDTNKTFTLAHEFGHYKLHERNGTKFRLDYDYSSDDEDIRQETDANYFAGSFLMPKDELLKIVSSTSDLNEVAKYFGVSRKALDVRLAWISRN